LFLLIASCPASAEELRLIVSGMALHEGSQDLNEKTTASDWNTNLTK